MKRSLLLIGGATPRMMERFSDHFVVHELAEIEDPEAFIRETGATIEAIATNGHDGVKPELMASLTNLKVISCFGVGYDAIDAKRAAQRGIMVTHTPNVLNDDVANTAIMLMLAVSRRLVRDDAWVRSGKWKSQGAAPLTRSIEKKPVGILGMGRIGRRIAEKLQAFDCDVSYHSRRRNPDVPYRYFADLIEMARAVDHLVVITPGGPATLHLVDRPVIDALGPEGTLINVARGSVVDEPELVKALEEGRLGGAGLDVFENEPDVPSSLISMTNVVLTPHVGSATVETRQAMGDLTVENLVRFFGEGKVTSPVPECAHLDGA